MKISKGKFLLILGIALVVIDQAIKVLVKTHMTIGQQIDVIGDWFKIYFIENEGMAFGMSWGGKVGKFLLSLFRIALFVGLTYWVSRLVRKDAAARSVGSDVAGAGLNGSVEAERVPAGEGGQRHGRGGLRGIAPESVPMGEGGQRHGRGGLRGITPESAPMGEVGQRHGRGGLRGVAPESVPMGVLVGLMMIAAGALGNIFDCYFYGLIFSQSTYTDVAVLGGHYAPFMFGRVVDMFYFPLIDTNFPHWLPLIGGNRFRFFAPVFNFADACVSCGAIYLILFQYRFFMKGEK